MFRTWILTSQITGRIRYFRFVQIVLVCLYLCPFRPRPSSIDVEGTYADLVHNVLLKPIQHVQTLISFSCHRDRGSTIPGSGIVRISAVSYSITRDYPVLSLQWRFPSYDNTLEKTFSSLEFSV